MSAFTLWNAPRACLWFASRDDAAVSSVPEDFTFAALAFQVEQELIDSDDDHAVVLDQGMTFGQLLGLRDQIAEYLGPPKADMPGTAWIGGAQKELLAACANGALKMTGRSLYGGSSRQIPAEAFATFRFFERDGLDCLGPPDLVDAECWRDLRLQAEDVRRVWPAGPAADATSPASTPATAFPQKPTYRREIEYSPERVPTQFQQWAKKQHRAGWIITEEMALTAMIGPEDATGKRSGGMLAPGKHLVRRTVRGWLTTLDKGWVATRGTRPARRGST